MFNQTAVNRSFWRATAHTASYTKLGQDVTVDVMVAGGGIAGVLTAYLAAKEGKTVALVEAREVGGGTTGGTTAKLSAQHELIYADLLQTYGLDVAKLYYQANAEGLQLIRDLVKDLAIECDFEPMTSYVYSQKGKHARQLEQEAEAYKKVGAPGDVQQEMPLDIGRHLDTDSVLTMENQAQFHPVKFLNGVLHALEDEGGHIYQHTMVEDVQKRGDSFRVTTNTPYTITAKQVIIATLFPAMDPHSFYSNRLKPVTSHLLAFPSDKHLGGGMYISADDPKRTVREAWDGKRSYLLVGGETHPTGDSHSTEERYATLLHYAQQTFGTGDPVDYWSEHELLTPDRLPYVGILDEEQEGMYVMTGFNKWGLTNAGVSSKLIVDLLLGKDNPYEKLFHPHRSWSTETAGGSDANGNTAPSLTEQVKELAAGDAFTTEVEGKQTGIYKDDRGTVHYLDLSCTHLGCEVRWNDGDATWDCPCHGSIFSGSGEVLAGPAKQPLQRVKPPQ
ncbi:FAD-dependent oxidoreductase [Sporosarcina sp. Te-1]|uniref:FAD-dependent oxidoreductase n=1 Tax=Sporosarcina sp. Te-1 TaxID=2818390 RepID=UPI001A9F3537|nr:FAD-dependent oxidoreductase [Sporosarcina sp. Te-1]QTD39554.1 FAD-dependent oxidoreductase [Sporosarcina sp. Te-1]